MAGPFTESWLGYAKETTYGTRVRAGTVADTATLVYGGWKGPFPMVFEKPKLIEYKKSGSFDIASQVYGNREVRFQLASNLLDPVRILEKVLGKLSTTGPSGSLYTHTVTAQEPVDGATLPSWTYHLQTLGMTAPYILDIPGSYSEEANLGYVSGELGVECLEKVLAQRITDENATSDINGNASATDEDDAKAYTNAPTNGDNITEADPFYLNELSAGGVDIVNDIITSNIKIKNEFKENRTSRPNKTNNYNKSINGYLSSAYVKDRTYEIQLELKPTDATLFFWDQVQSHSLDTDIVAKYVRTANSLTHTMDLTFDTTTCPVTDISGMIPFLHNELQKWIVVLKPKTLVSAVCKDEAPDTD